MNYLFLLLLNLGLPLIGYGIAGFSSMIFMVVIALIVDYVAVFELIRTRKAKKQYGRNAEHYLFTDRDSSICDLDVYKNGKSLGLFDMRKQDAEDYCKKQTQETGMKHDWHYFAGRVHILYLDGDKNGTTD